MSKSQLSQIERGRASGSLETLEKIAEAVALPLFALFVEPGAPLGVVRRAERLRLRYPGSNVELECVTPTLTNHLVVLETTVLPGERGTASRMAHGGEEMVLVQTGEVTVVVGDTQTVLVEGDAYTFDVRVPHILQNDGSAPCTVLVVLVN